MKRLFSISILLMFLFSGTNAQNIQLDTLVDLTFEKITLKQALQEISQQFEISFSYSDSKIPVDNIVSVSYSSTELGRLLHELLRSHKTGYSIIENQVVLFPVDIDQTITVKGKLVDKRSGSAIPFANISVSGTNKGTSSNEDGEFEITLNKLPSELRISHLSHKRRSIYVYDDAQLLEIGLMPAETTLRDVTVRAKRNKNAYYRLIKKAYDEINRNRGQANYGKAFYRQKSKRETKFTEIFELFYDVKYSANGIEDWAVQEGRYALQNDNEYDIFLYNKNFTLLSRMFPILQPKTESYLSPVHPDVKKLFNLHLKEIITFDERFIAVIAYAPKPGTVLPSASGELYIDIDNYQILKLTGSFSDPSLEIIGFGDQNSAWDNYQLDFEISFIDDHMDRLLMDHIKINHQFDYYFRNEYIGKINTSSLLTFYEHYTPVKNKKLGGAINFKTSDMEVIDRIGYNPNFWSQNAIVKRTPLEEALVRDFEENQAFGAVFMNNGEEVVLLPDSRNIENAQQIIAEYEKKYPKNPNHHLLLRLDKNSYMANDHIRFTAHVRDRWTLKPSVLGSVLSIDIYDYKDQLILNKKFDIHEGNAYGEIDLSVISKPGSYLLKATTNIPDGQHFEQDFAIYYDPNSVVKSEVDVKGTAARDMKIEFYPESGILLHGAKTKVVFTAHTVTNKPVSSKWLLVDSIGTILQTIKSNQLGIGMFELTADRNSRFFLKSYNPDHPAKWSVPKAKASGFSIKIDDDQSRSIHAELHQHPPLPRSIILLSISNGKVFSLFEKKMYGSKTAVDLPAQHLPGGINTFVAMDRMGNILAQRQYFVQPRPLNIRLESATWKSKKSKRMELKFRISNQNNMPTKAHLSAVCSPVHMSEEISFDIRDHLYFGAHEKLQHIHINPTNDSILSLINNALVSENSDIGDLKRSTQSVRQENETLSELMALNSLVEPVTAEFNVSGNFGSEGASHKRKSIQNKKEVIPEAVYWVPILEIDDHGVAVINYRAGNRNEEIYVNIQGLSDDGLVGHQDFIIDPGGIKIKKSN